MTSPIKSCKYVKSIVDAVNSKERYGFLKVSEALKDLKTKNDKYLGIYCIEAVKIFGKLPGLLTEVQQPETDHIPPSVESSITTNDTTAESSTGLYRAAPRSSQVPSRYLHHLLPDDDDDTAATYRHDSTGSYRVSINDQSPVMSIPSYPTRIKNWFNSLRKPPEPLPPTPKPSPLTPEPLPPTPGVPEIEKLFSFLMHDWYNPKPGQTYDLVEKVDLFFRVNNTEVFDKLFYVIDHQKKMYLTVALRLLYQYLYELDNIYTFYSDQLLKELDSLKKLIFLVEHSELKIRGLKIIAIYWLICCKDKNRIIQFREEINRTFSSDLQDKHEEAFKFLDLCFSLKSGNCPLMTFQTEFEEYLGRCEEHYGDYYNTYIHHNIQLLSFLASKEESPLAENYIFQKFPGIGINDTILEYFNRTRAFTSFHLENFEASKLKKFVSFMFIFQSYI